MFEQFVKHLFPKKINESAITLMPTFYLGGLLMIVFIFLTVSGMLLLFYYSPTPEHAFDSVIFIEEEVFGGAFIRSFHRMCSHIFLVLTAMHLLRVILSGAYKYRTFSYRLGMFIFGIIIFEAYAGYLLPMDQLSWWAAKTGLELAGTLPFGSVIENILAPGGVGTRLTLTRYFVLHSVMIPFLLTLLVSVHMYAVRRDGLLKDTRKVSVDALYPLLIKIFATMFSCSVILTVVFGAPLSEVADPSSPPNPVKSAWFLLWIQEVVSWRAWLFNIIVLIYIGFFFLPEISKRESGHKYFSRDDFPVWGITLFLTISVAVLTIIAMFFRGADWAFVF